MATYGAPTNGNKNKNEKTNLVLLALGGFAALAIVGGLLPDSEKGALPKKEQNVATLNRPAAERCNSESADCKKWTAWALSARKT